MGNFSADLISILQFLLPGFFAAWVYYGLTAETKPSQFERVIEALIFTLIVQVLTVGVRAALTWIGQYWALGAWDANAELTTSTASALLLGVVRAYLANNDGLYAFLREKKLTKQTSYPSEWYAVFARHVMWVVLHLEDGRRIYGWPREWPQTPKSGHFALEVAEWLVDDTEEGRRPLTGVETILIRAEEVRFVEFVQVKEPKRGKEAIESAAAEAA